MIWAMQGLPESLERQMAVLAKNVFDILTSDNRAVQNVTEWSKREVCWDQIKALEPELIPEAGKWLVDREEIRSIAKSAKRDQRIISGIEAQTFVVNLGAEYWSDMLQWAIMKRLISSQEEQNILGLAARMPVVLPNDYQCRRLQDIRNKMLSEGFKASG